MFGVGELSPVFLECDTPMGWWMEMISKLQIYPDRRSVWPEDLVAEEGTHVGRSHKPIRAPINPLVPAV
jgi:hypothetical protein